MTLGKKLVACLFSALLGASLAGMPLAALADDAPAASKGIADQFSAFSEDASDAALDASGEPDTSADETVSAGGQAEDAEDQDVSEEGYDGLDAGQDASGAWQSEQAPDTYVFDESGLFSSSEYAVLEQSAEQLASQYNMGVYFLTTDLMGDTYYPTSSERTRFATKYYMDHALGLGSGKDGIMFVVAVDSRDYVTIAYGQGSYAFGDEGIEDMESDVKSCLSDDDWYGGATAYYSDMATQLGHYEKHGTPWRPISLVGVIVRLAFIIVLPLVIALSVVGGWKRSMKTAQQKSEASDYLDQSSLVLTDSSDEFINSAVVATPRREESDSGGGGGWGGGGGGGFSSSGGGKF